LPRIAEIYRYPVKGLSAEPMQRVAIGVGEVIPFDRAYAIENGPSSFDPTAPKWITKAAFLVWMRHERLAELHTSFDTGSHILTIRRDGMIVVAARLDTEEGRREIEAFFDQFSADDLKGPAKVLSAPGFSFQDTSTGNVVSLINFRTICEIGQKVGAEVHPLRFRANLYVDMPAWEEFSWVGREVVAGNVRLQGTKRIDRCAAINVNPITAARDLNLPRSMMHLYGHADCGIYLKVIEGGEFAVGDTIAPVLV
jgi:uncharacterized protein YcbX